MVNYFIKKINELNEQNDRSLEIFKSTCSEIGNSDSDKKNMYSSLIDIYTQTVRFESYLNFTIELFNDIPEEDNGLERIALNEITICKDLLPELSKAVYEKKIMLADEIKKIMLGKN